MFVDFSNSQNDFSSQWQCNGKDSVAGVFNRNHTEWKYLRIGSTLCSALVADNRQWDCAESFLCSILFCMIFVTKFFFSYFHLLSILYKFNSKSNMENLIKSFFFSREFWVESYHFLYSHHFGSFCVVICTQNTRTRWIIITQQQ